MNLWLSVSGFEFGVCYYWERVVYHSTKHGFATSCFHILVYLFFCIFKFRFVVINKAGVGELEFRQRVSFCTEGGLISLQNEFVLVICFSILICIVLAFWNLELLKSVHGLFGLQVSGCL